eukprot:c14957_g1_i1 orf=232-1038(+)
MASAELSSKLERSRSRGGEGHMRSESETHRNITEMRLSSFDSITGEQVITRGGMGGVSMREWAMLVEPAEGTVTSGAKKKVMVVIDGSRESRLAMLWALSHIVHHADTLTLIHVLPSPHKYAGLHILAQPSAAANLGPQARRGRSDLNLKVASQKVESRPSQLGLSLKMLCTSRRPEVEVEVMTVEGNDKGPTIVSQAKKLEASVLVLGQRKPSLLQRLFNQRSPNDGVVEYCIQNAECLTLAVRKKSKQMGGYLINSRWQKNFWLLA